MTDSNAMYLLTVWDSGAAQFGAWEEKRGAVVSLCAV